MTNNSPKVLDAIGDTPLARLRRVVPLGSTKVLAKLEFTNPTGSMKDRVAKAMVEAAAADGRFKPVGTVVEYTAGPTGISLALVRAALGYGLKIVFSHVFADEKRHTIGAFSAKIQIVKSDKKKVTDKRVSKSELSVALTIIGASFGCAVAAIILSLGKYWTHINPAITVAHAVAGAISSRCADTVCRFSNIGRFVSWLDSTAYVSIR